MTIRCDAIKIAYRQSKEGFVISFAIHPQDIPAELANAAIGSQWQLTLVELDEHGNAGEVPAPSILAAEPLPSTSASRHGEPAPDDNISREDLLTPCDAPLRMKREPAPEVIDIKTTALERRRFDTLPLPQQAALLCADPIFQKWLDETFCVCHSEEEAAAGLRTLCLVKSRRELRPDNPAGKVFISQRDKFMAWKLVA